MYKNLKLHEKFYDLGFLIPVLFLFLQACSSDDDFVKIPEEIEVETVKIQINVNDNLQWMNFWVADGANYFEEEGIRLEIIWGENPNDSFLDGEAEIAIQTRTQFWQSIAKEVSILAFANLLENEPINLIIKKEIAEERGLTSSLSLKERLEGLNGLNIGLAQGPIPRLDYLFESQDLVIDDLIRKVIVHDQNEAFESGEVDGLFTHTPYLEKAMMNQNGYMLINLSRAELNGLSNRNIHMLVAKSEYVETNRNTLVRISRAICKAQQLIHTDKFKTKEALQNSVLKLTFPEGLEKIIEIYEPAIPKKVAFIEGGWLKEIPLLPNDNGLEGITLEEVKQYYSNEFALVGNCN
ncbi:ABC transporter substrate-binding protein [Aureivirga marina]|uniref:ABC transporter substrate-binding protein n=1 Tax=Aureivirga marina TaxID=1182451 RepID=UPI0018CB7D0B|nr:ABC transporter substrate-binding protein [Aureivirga marina]